MEKEVVEMRNSFKEKEKTLTEERDKAIKAAEYVKHFLFYLATKYQENVTVCKLRKCG